MGCDWRMCQNLNTWDVFWVNRVQMQCVVGRRVAGNIRYLVNARDLQLECARVLHETLLLPVLMYGSETVMKEKERSKVRTIQMDNLRGLLGIGRVDRVPNARIKEFCGMTKGLNEKIDEVFLRWFGHV